MQCHARQPYPSPRRRPAGSSLGPRGDAAHGSGDLGRAGRPRRGHRGAAACARARHHPDRHGRLLRPRSERAAHRRGVAPLSQGPRHRFEGRVATPGSRSLDARRPAGTPASGVRGQPAAAEDRAHRPLSAAPDRSRRAARGPARHPQGAAGAGQDPPPRALRGDGRGDRAGAAHRLGRLGAEPLQPQRPQT